MMDWSTSMMIGRSMGIDVAWGETSKFAIVITQYRNRKVEAFYAESFEKPQMNGHHQSHHAVKAEASHNKDLRGWCKSRSHKGVEVKDRRIP